MFNDEIKECLTNRAREQWLYQQMIKGFVDKSSTGLFMRIPITSMPIAKWSWSPLDSNKISMLFITSQMNIYSVINFRLIRFVSTGMFDTEYLLISAMLHHNVEYSNR